MAFEIKERTAVSETSIIYEGTNKENGRAILKFLKEPFNKNDQVAGALPAWEPRAGEFKHEHLAEILEYGKQNERPFIAEEYVEHSLRSYLEQKETISLKIAVKILRGVIQGLIHLRENGVPVHGVVNPEHIRLEENAAKVKLGEYHIADAIERFGGDDRGLMQHPSYMAPEQIHRVGEMNSSCDMYALGTIFFEMLVGNPLYYDKPPDKLKYQQLYTDSASTLEIHQELPAKVREIIGRCLQKNPSTRFTTLEEFDEALDVLVGSVATERPETYDERVGKDVSGYLLEDILGHGRFSSVFKARDKKSGRLVAMKIFNEDISADADFIQVLEQDLLQQAQVRHPQICSLIANGRAEVGSTGKQCYFVVNDFRDSSLSKLIEEGNGLPAEKALDYCRKAAGVLEYVHQQDRPIPHMAVFPEHILIDSGTQEVALTDFFCWKSYEYLLGKYGEHYANVAYLPPEFIDAGNHSGAPSDIYQLGLCLFYALTGRNLYPGELDPDWKAEIRKGGAGRAIKRQAGIPMVLHDVLLKMLDVDPAKRYSSFEDLFNDFAILIKKSKTGVDLELIDVGSVISKRIKLEERNSLFEEPPYYLGRHLETDLPMGMWFYRKSASEATEKAFEEAMEKYMRLSNKAALIIHEHGRDKGAYYFATDYRPLNVRLKVQKDGPMPLEDALYLLKEVLALFVEIENLDLKPHLSLSPDWILLPPPTSKDSLKIGGFEIAHIFKNPLEKGEPAYLAPEQITQLGTLGYYTDAYSLGLILYFMITGEDLFKGETAQEITQAQVFTDPMEIVKQKITGPLPLLNMLGRCLVKDAEMRYESYRDLQDDLDDVLASLTEGDQSEGVVPFFFGTRAYSMDNRQPEAYCLAYRVPANMVGIRGVFIMVQGWGEDQGNAELARGKAMEVFESSFSPSLLCGLDSPLTPKQMLEKAFQKANGIVEQEAFRLGHHGKMGAEALVGLIAGNRLYIGRIGAGFSNVIRGESLRVFLSAPRDKKVLGQEMLFEMNYTERHLRPGDVLVMGTADLNHVVSDQEIRNIARSTSDAEEAAERLLSLARSRFKGDVTPTLGMGVVVLHLGDFMHEQAAKEGRGFQSAPVLHHYINSGQEYLNQGDIERAIQEFQKGLKINPDAFSVQYQLALAHLKKGSAHTAERYCERAIELFPSFIDGYCTLGDIKAANRLWHMAEEKYFAAIEFGPNNAAGYIALGDFYFGRGRLLLARMTYQRGLNSVQTSAELQQRLERITRMLKNPLYWLVAGWNGFWAALTPKKRG